MTITLSVDISNITDGQKADAADVTVPINDLKVHLENILNGVQKFERLLFSPAFDYIITGGIITIDKTSIVVDTEGAAATDNLDTIHGIVDGDIIILRAKATTRDIIITDGVGNIVTKTGTTITLDSTEKLVLLLGRVSDILAVEFGSDPSLFGARKSMTADESIPNNTARTLSWQTFEYADGGDWIVAANNTLEFPIAGVYIVGVQIEWESNSSGIRRLWLKNGVAPGDVWAETNNDATAGSDGQSLVIVKKFSAGDLINAPVYQNSGGALDILSGGGTFFWAQLLRAT